MKIKRFLILGIATMIAATSAFAVLSFGPGGDGVTVGSSTLIGQLDYSDTWTETASGGIPGRPGVGAFPVGAPGINVEDNHGNPPQVWTNFKWSMVHDAGPGLVGSYPGGSGAGSATGITQTGGGVDFGIEYNLRRNYVVQFDGVQADDRIDITTGAVRDTIFNAGNVSFFFRAGAGGPPSIGIYNGATETDTGFTTGLGVGEIGRWHNYAVHFDLDNGLAGLFVDEGLRGTINLATFASGAYSSILGATGNDAISVGSTSHAGISWTDNFQVGTFQVPEPSTLVLIGLGLSGLWWMRRSRR